jgi:hypothetical protein
MPSVRPQVEIERRAPEVLREVQVALLGPPKKEGGAMKLMSIVLTAVLLAQQADDRKTTEKKVLDKINAYRKSCGFGPVTMDDKLSKGCQLHCEYLAKNKAQGHEEDQKKPGYTAEGAQAGMSSCVHYREPLEAVDGWMNSVYHRTPILNPGLQRVGLGYAKSEGSYCALDVKRGVAGGRWPDAIIYPPDKAKGVPTSFAGESPSPLPNGFGDAGYPLTAQFREGTGIKDAEATIKDGSGKSLETYVLTPDNGDATYIHNTIGVFAKGAFSAKTTYTVTISAKVGGKAWTRTWSFTTTE